MPVSSGPSTFSSGAPLLFAGELALDSGFRCIYCDRYLLESIDSFDLWENDHLEPTSRGGEDNLQNMALSCRLCNKIKRHWVPADLMSLDRAGRIRAAREYVEEGRRRKEAYLDSVKAILRENSELPREPSS